MFKMNERPRRNRRTEQVRRMVHETDLSARNLVLPVFILADKDARIPVVSMPGIFREGISHLLETCDRAVELGIPGLALFPVIDPSQKNETGSEAINPKGLVPETVRMLKKEFPELTLFCDIALDPYTSHGHDGLIKNGVILNDETIAVLCEQAKILAEAGADFVSPSDMMDGRIGAIRNHLDNAGFTQTGILSYCAKYASAFYGPFRDALASAPQFGDKKTYQMDPRNRREALREARLDTAEGADILMVKPALAYLDVIADLRTHSDLPIAAYQVSGEYAMVKAAQEKGWINGPRVMMESLISIRRAGADLIFTYAALEIAEALKRVE